LAQYIGTLCAVNLQLGQTTSLPPLCSSWLLYAGHMVDDGFLNTTDRPHHLA